MKTLFDGTDHTALLHQQTLTVLESRIPTRTGSGAVESQPGTLEKQVLLFSFRVAKLTRQELELCRAPI